MDNIGAWVDGGGLKGVWVDKGNTGVSKQGGIEGGLGGSEEGEVGDNKLGAGSNSGQPGDCGC